MAKDRNTMAKRQREVEKREKSARKREKRLNRKTQADNPAESFHLSADEWKVLGIFKRYLMTAGSMLCLGSNDIDQLGESLDSMVDSGLLVAEDPKGGYSLTESGVRAMAFLRPQASVLGS